MKSRQAGPQESPWHSSECSKRVINDKKFMTEQQTLTTSFTNALSVETAARLTALTLGPTCGEPVGDRHITFLMCFAEAYPSNEGKLGTLAQFITSLKTHESIHSLFGWIESIE
jgi:hypothetical protein